MTVQELIDDLKDTSPTAPVYLFVDGLPWGIEGVECQIGEDGDVSPSGDIVIIYSNGQKE